jgi:competence protein ComGF
MPSRSVTSSAVIANQLSTFAEVEKEFSRVNMQDLLHDFFKDKASRILEENSLLISRWSRFCRSTREIVKYKQIFSGHQSRLKAEYNDSIERYERLHEIKLALEKGTRGEEV